ncbi:MAG: hypothetical protein LT080_08220 [Thiobacillus sp.]|nr:hypothetical protein [Thiobacillus sp.]
MHTTERIPRSPHAGSNFERATARMQSRGCRPFQPDLNHGRAERVLRPIVHNPEPDARPIDRIIGTVGVVGVGVVAFLLLVEQFIAWIAS